MRLSRAGIAASFVVGTLVGCAPPEPARAPLNELAGRAAFDLDCPAQWLRLTEIDEHVKGVDGCGRRATYVEVCQGANGACAWWNNTAPALAAQAPAPPPFSLPANGATPTMQPPTTASNATSPPNGGGTPASPTLWR